MGAASKTEDNDMNRKAGGERADIYARITDRIVADLENHAGLTPAALGPYMLGLETAA